MMIYYTFFSWNGKRPGEKISGVAQPEKITKSFGDGHSHLRSSLFRSESKVTAFLGVLEIAFEKVGTKKLFANFARLTKL